MELGKVADVGAHGPDESRERLREDIRFTEPLYTVKRAAFYLAVPEQTLRDWATKYSLVKIFPARGRREATMPFIGLAEAFVVAAFRRYAKRHLSYVLKALKVIEESLGIEYALANNRLAVHGRAILVDMAESGDTQQFEEALSRNKVFDRVVEGDLKYINYGEDGWAQRLILPWTSQPLVEVTPERAFGQPVLKRSGARVIDVIDRFNAGEDPKTVAEDFRVSEAAVLDIVRVFTRKAKQVAA